MPHSTSGFRACKRNSMTFHTVISLHALLSEPVSVMAWARIPFKQFVCESINCQELLLDHGSRRNCMRDTSPTIKRRPREFHTRCSTLKSSGLSCRARYAFWIRWRIPHAGVTLHGTVSARLRTTLFYPLIPHTHHCLSSMSISRRNFTVRQTYFSETQLTLCLNCTFPHIWDIPALSFPLPIVWKFYTDWGLHK